MSHQQGAIHTADVREAPAASERRCRSPHPEAFARATIPASAYDTPASYCTVPSCRSAAILAALQLEASIAAQLQPSRVRSSSLMRRAIGKWPTAQRRNGNAISTIESQQGEGHPTLRASCRECPARAT